ncbi:MAG: Crp/Fnr family transcriptional regulator [Bacteroides sp.]|nr:Crp/Fnr family transcriptional regulator [Bacteroidales bacterium]MBD5250953.1 Crp/Fnr family transcriptional regulator [Barnesiella sp.]MBD5344687.1 Crp/Fnr family transcriptional regulator [Bacteroides sp.]MBD5368951.1 Crp/Fnr family transcriptional regulator [Bacteroides sp.]
MEQTMFETLMNLPLFKGVSYKRLSEIVGNTKLAFMKYLQGETLIFPDDTCDSLKFILSGKVRLAISTHDERFTVSSVLEGPSVIMPEYLFGRSTVYPCRVTAVDSVSVMQISKSDLTRLLSTDEIFLFNYINLISSSAQKSVEGVLALTSGSLEERIAFWVLALSQHDSKDIILSCRQRDLCAVFGVQRSSFTAALDHLKSLGYIDYTSDSIKVKSRRDMASLLIHARD